MVTLQIKQISAADTAVMITYRLIQIQSLVGFRRTVPFSPRFINDTAKTSISLDSREARNSSNGDLGSSYCREGARENSLGMAT
jgi:hypothetical protein